MAKTFKMVNGDFERGTVGNYTTITGTSLLSQHVYQAVMEVTNVEDINSIDAGDTVQDMVESLLSMRIYLGIDQLAQILRDGSARRDTNEKIERIKALIVKRSKSDKRTFRAWIQVESQAFGTSEITATI